MTRNKIEKKHRSNIEYTDQKRGLIIHQKIATKDIKIEINVDGRENIFPNERLFYKVRQLKIPADYNSHQKSGLFSKKRAKNKCDINQVICITNSKIKPGLESSGIVNCL